MSDIGIGIDVAVRLYRAPRIQARANTAAPLNPTWQTDVHRQYGLDIGDDLLMWLPADDTERTRTIDRLQAALEGLRAPSSEGLGTYSRYDSQSEEKDR